MTAEPDAALPGADLVADGLAALRRGDLTAAALLVAIGAPRLRELGLDVPANEELPDEPELALYRLVGLRHPLEAHAQYNALIARLVSFEAALDAQAARSARRRGREDQRRGAANTGE